MLLYRSRILPLIGLLLLAPTVRAADAVTPAQIARAIQQLSDDDFAVREKASQFLWKAGRAAEPALQQAARGNDLEVSYRARVILLRFKWGIYPDTPSDILEQIRQYQVADYGNKHRVIRKLLGMGSAGRSTALKLATAEENADLRRTLLDQLVDETIKLCPRFLVQGKIDAVDEMLEASLASGQEAAYRHYAALQLLRGRLDAKISQWQARRGQLDPVPASDVLIYLYRARGDLDKARIAAQDSKKPVAVHHLLEEKGAWDDLLGSLLLPVGDTSSKEIEALGLRAAYQERSRRMPQFEETIRKIRAVSADAPTDADDAWLRARMLLLNDRPQEAIDLLRKSANPGKALELLASQMRFREAFEAADHSPPAKPPERLKSQLARASALVRLGQKEQARTLLSHLGAEIPDVAHPDAEPPEKEETLDYSDLVKQEIDLGFRDLAFEHATLLLRRTKNEPGAASLLEQLFPEKGPTADLWWRFLRHQFTDEEAPAIMKRLREVMTGKAAVADLQAWAEQPGELADTAAHREQWLQAVADAFHLAGKDTEARTYLEKAVEARSASADALFRLGDFLADKHLWKEAANRYAQAARKDPKNAQAVYFQGWALQQAGETAEGKDLMEIAHWLPLADEAVRHSFAEALLKRDMLDAARREHELMDRLASLESEVGAWEVSDAHRYMARDAVSRKDYLQAARYYEFGLFDCLRAKNAFTHVSAYLAVPYLVHRYRAQGLLQAGHIDDALREANLALTDMPGEVDIPIELGPLLEKQGRKKDADDLFTRVFAVYAQMTAEQPQSAIGHNSLAWLAARCRRELDQALVHARKAVDLSPDDAGLLDTLAEVHFQRGDKDRAIELMRRCIALSPKNDYYKKQLTRFQAGDPTVDVPDPGE